MNSTSDTAFTTTGAEPFACLVPATQPARRTNAPHEPFVPLEPASWEQAGVSQNEVSAIALRYLLSAGQATGRNIAEQLKLPFGLTQELLRGLRQQLFLQYRNTSIVGDFDYELTSQGLDRARRLSEHCTYCGAAPVAFDAYTTSVRAQSFQFVRTRIAAVRHAYRDLLLSDAKLYQIGQAIGAARGLFLYGPSGNGKSSVAERLIRTVGDTIWIPRAISVAGEIIRLFDPSSHVEVQAPPNQQLINASQTDRRWVCVQRPTIVVGGELTLQHLEVIFNPSRGVNEAPLQLKSNGGVLVIDDFGRQRISAADLLNRFIVPLEKRFDLVSLPSGRQIQIPFDSMLVFATNLEPKQVFDDAFLRRLPYKIAMTNPTPAEFRQLFESAAEELGVRFDADCYEQLLTRHFTGKGRPFRFCHARDLVEQVRTLCEFHEVPAAMSSEVMDVAAHNYFAGF
jgi:hypothetical protein